MRPRLGVVTRLSILAAIVLLALPASAPAQGIILPGGGAAHLAMGGASTATPVDAIGALYWNPAGIGRLNRSEVAVGGAFLFPILNLSSTDPTGRQSGRTGSDSGTGVGSNLGVVYQPDEQPFTIGMGLNAIGGGSVNYPGDLRNPILSGIGPLGNVQGPIYANMGLLQITPTAAYRVTDRLLIGAGPTIDIALASFDPAYFGAPDDANGDGIGTFPTATHMRPFWGGGFRAGLIYSLTERLDVGFGYTSEQWFEPWLAHARNELGLPRTLRLDVTLPPIYSWGVAYRPTDRLQLAVDLRYLDYKNSNLFGTRIVNGGLGWRSVFAVAVGGRFQATERVALSAGYVYNDNPIPSVGTLFNVQAPAIIQHTIAVGTTVNVTEAMSMSLGYLYGFRNTLTGPVREATGRGVSFDSQLHAVTFSMQFQFGRCGCKPVTPVDYPCPPAASSAAPATENSRAGG